MQLILPRHHLARSTATSMMISRTLESVRVATLLLLATGASTATSASHGAAYACRGSCATCAPALDQVRIVRYTLQLQFFKKAHTSTNVQTRTRCLGLCKFATRACSAAGGILWRGGAAHCQAERAESLYKRRCTCLPFCLPGVRFRVRQRVPAQGSKTLAPPTRGRAAN